MPIVHATTTGKIGETQWNEAHDLSSFTPDEIGAVAGSGVVGQVAEFVANTTTLQAAKLIAPTANILTLTNAAAATLALNITAAKTLTLTAVDNYGLTVAGTSTINGSLVGNMTGGGTVATGGFTLTVPATGTAALLATANVFTTQQMVDGTSDQIQLRVQGHSTQTATLQTWENSSATVLALINGVGSLGLGTTPGAGTKLSISNSVAGTNIGIETVSATTAGGTAYGSRIRGRMVGNLNAAVFGVEMTCVADSANAAVTMNASYSFKASLESALTSLQSITTHYQFYGGYNLLGTNTKTNLYGLYLENIPTATNSYAIYTNSGLNRLGDQLVIVGSADRRQLQVTGFTTQTLPVGYLIDNTAETAAVRNVLQLEAQSTGTAAAGLGAGLLFSIETATASTNQNAGLISASWVDATNATRKAKLSLSAYDTAERLGLEIEANGTASKSTFYGTLTTNGRRQKVTTTAIDYTALTTDEVIVATTSLTVTLPAATGTGQTYRIVCRAGTLTIDGNGTDTIKGSLTQTLTSGEDLLLSDTATGIWE